jgi:hypothetical protein
MATLFDTTRHDYWGGRVLCVVGIWLLGEILMGRYYNLRFGQLATLVPRLYHISQARRSTKLLTIHRQRFSSFTLLSILLRRLLKYRLLNRSISAASVSD